MNWTKEEKTILLRTLKTYGVDIQRISEALPGKAVHEIRNTLNQYENLALQSLGNSSEQQEDAPLDKWIKVLQQHSSRNNHNLIPRILKYIALFEKRFDDPVKLNECYLVLSDLMSGKPSKEMDLETTYFLNDCFSALAREVREENIDDKLTFLKEINFVERKKNTYGKKNINTNNSITLDNDINVCGIPTDLLKD